jgi:hypothetical protein
MPCPRSSGPDFVLYLSPKTGWLAVNSVERDPTHHSTMNKNLIINCLLILAGLAMPLVSLQAQPTTPALVPVEKTSFTEVTSQLDPGGNFYLYLSTARWLENLSRQTRTWRQKMETMPNLNTEDLQNIDNGFNLLDGLIKDSGIENVSGVGMSSIEIETNLYRNKMLLHHYPGQGDGFLWKLCGGQPHPLEGLDFLPANTALAVFTDADLPLLWSVTQQEVAQSKFTKAQTMLATWPDQFEKQTQLKWDDVLHSLGGEYGFALTLDESNKVPIPLPAGLIDIPEPALLLVIKINDDTIFNRIDSELKTNQQVISTDDSNLRMRTMPIPIPMAVNLRPSIATGGGYLFIGSSDGIIRQALEVKNGQKPGLKSTAEFKRLSQGIPDQGNQFSYVSELFGQTVMQIQKQLVSAHSANGQDPQQAQWIQSLFYNRAMHAYSVGQNTDSGCLLVGNSSQSEANAVVLPAVAMTGAMAAIAVPNFVKARAVSQRNACINNLRMIDAAKEQWALEKNKKDGDVPTQEDLLPYLRTWPVCPGGGTYTIGAIGQPPTCSIPDHKLP